MTLTAKRPRRPVDRDTKFFADGLTNGVILIQRCTNCSELRHPPKPVCANCRSFDWTTIEASGRGQVYTFAIHHAPPLPAFPSPHVILLVELEEGVRMIGDLTDTSRGVPLAIGTPLTAVITAEPGDDMLLVRWQVDGAPEA